MSDAWVSPSSSVITSYLWILISVICDMSLSTFSSNYAPTEAPNRSQNPRSLQLVGWAWRWAPPADHSLLGAFLSSSRDSALITKDKSNNFLLWYHNNGPVILKIRLLNTALEMLLVEKQDKEKEREQVLSERVPPLNFSGLSVQELQVQLNDLNGSLNSFYKT